MAAHPTEEKKDEREGSRAGRGRKGGGFPSLIEMMVERNENHAEKPDESDERAERHEVSAEHFALALASKTGRSM
jgi:hypothetical protein